MIIQQAFIIPPDLQPGLVSGDLVQWGGVVRNLSGQIVRHLKEAPVPEASESAAVSAVSSRVLNFVRSSNNVNPWIAVPAAVAGAAMVVFAVVAVKKHQQAIRVERPDCVKEYNAALQTYLDAVGAGQLNEEIIENLISSLDAVVAYEDEGGKILLDFTSKQAQTLIRMVADATNQLIDSNDLHLDKLSKRNGPDEADNVVDLRRYLEVQRNIFKEAG